MVVWREVVRLGIPRRETDLVTRCNVTALLITSTSLRAAPTAPSGRSTWNGSAWSSWKSLGGQVAPNTGPAVSQDLWLFVQGTDHQLWRTASGGRLRQIDRLGHPRRKASRGAVHLVTGHRRPLHRPNPGVCQQH